MPARVAEPTTGRLAGPERRESLLDAAASLVAEGRIDAVSMESVAERAGVSRPLVYKHFANREEILAAVYRREAQLLHEQMAAEVTSAGGGVEAMFTALIRAALRAARERGALFTSLRHAGAGGRALATEQRARDRATSRAFTRRAVRELGVDATEAARTIALLLGLIDQVVAHVRADPTATNERLWESTYVTIVRATLAALPRVR